jgi:hypothetical protein
MSQKRHFPIQEDPKLFNLIDTFKFVATNPVNVFDGTLAPAKGDASALTDIEVKFIVLTPILQTIQIGLKTQTVGFPRNLGVPGSISVEVYHHHHA